MINSYTILVANPEGRTPSGRPKWEDRSHKGIRYHSADWINMARTETIKGFHTL
jgi:hypothetical protein